MWHNKQRYQSIPRVLSDLKRLAAMGGTQMGFAGDGFGNPPDYHLELANEMVKSGIDMDWVSFMRVDSLLREPRLAPAMARAGCKAVFIGFESPRQDLLKKWNKGPDGCAEASSYPEVYRMLDSQGILVFGFMVVGHPDEKPEELVEQPLERVRSVEPLCLVIHHAGTAHRASSQSATTGTDRSR